jgi:hypothetical protein
VATAARRTVATSEGGGRPSRQSRPERLAFHQCPFMLPLEVVGPGGSLSTALIATPYRRDASRRVSWQAATATAGSGCDRTSTALVHRLGTAGGGGGEADRIRRRRMPNLLNVCVEIRLVFVSYVFVFGDLFGLFLLHLNV